MSEGPFVVLFWREERDEYARGCRVGRVEAAFNVWYFDTTEQLVEAVAVEAFCEPRSPMVAIVLRRWKDVLAVADKVPAGRSFADGHDVVFVPCDSENFEDDYVLEAKLGKMVRARVEAIRQEKSDAAVRETLLKSEAEARAAKDAELKKLRELRAKYPDA